MLLTLKIYPTCAPRYKLGNATRQLLCDLPIPLLRKAILLLGLGCLSWSSGVANFNVNDTKRWQPRPVSSGSRAHAASSSAFDLQEALRDSATIEQHTFEWYAQPRGSGCKETMYQGDGVSVNAGWFLCPVPCPLCDLLVDKNHLHLYEQE